MNLSVFVYIFIFPKDPAFHFIDRRVVVFFVSFFFISILFFLFPSTDFWIF